SSLMLCTSGASALPEETLKRWEAATAESVIRVHEGRGVVLGVGGDHHGELDRIKTLPALLIVTFRPEFNAPWTGQSHVTSLTLNRLGEREATAIIARLVENKELPADVLAGIVERSDGIPL